LCRWWSPRGDRDEDHGARGHSPRQGRAPAAHQHQVGGATRAAASRKGGHLPAALHCGLLRGADGEHLGSSSWPPVGDSSSGWSRAGGSPVAERPIDPPRPCEPPHAKRRRDVAEGGCPVAELLPDRVAVTSTPAAQHRAVPGKETRRRRRAARRRVARPEAHSARGGERAPARAGRRAPPAETYPRPHHDIGPNRRMMRRASSPTGQTHRKAATVAGWAKSRPRYPGSRGDAGALDERLGDPARRRPRSTAPPGQRRATRLRPPELGSGAPRPAPAINVRTTESPVVAPQRSHASPRTPGADPVPTHCRVSPPRTGSSPGRCAVADEGSGMPVVGIMAVTAATLTKA